LIYPDTGYLGKIRYLEGLELSEEELGDEGADKGGGNLLLGMAPRDLSMLFESFELEDILDDDLCSSSALLETGTWTLLLEVPD